MSNADGPISIVDPYKVGVVAKHLLVRDDTSVYNKAQLVLNRPEDITGEQIMARKVRDIMFKDMLSIDSMAAALRESSNVALSRDLLYAPSKTNKLRRDPRP